MTFSTVQFNVTGGTYQSRSRPLSSQRTVNMYQQLSEAGKDKFVLHSFPGQSLISSVDGVVDRGQHQMREAQYRVVDTTLYKVDSQGVHTAKGTIQGGSRCIFEDDGENLVIVAGTVYVYNSFTDTLVQNEDPILFGAKSVTIINNQFIYTLEDFSFMSDPGQPLVINSLNGVGAESSPDRLVRDYVFNQTIYRFGFRTTELWYNSGVGAPPIDRIDGQEFSVGLGAIHSLANTDNALYWLGDDRSIYRVSGNITEKISDDGLSNTIELMDEFEDAYGYAFTLQGQDFYLITFPSGNRTFVINERLGVNGWFELSSGTSGDSYSATSLLEVYGKLIVANGGKILELKLDEYTQDTDTIIRTRVTSSLNGGALGVKGQRIKLSRLELIMETGIGLITGQGENPRVLVETSIDGGRSFAHSDWVEIGRLGQNTLRAEMYRMISGEDIMFRVSMSDPVPLSIYSAAADIKLVGR